MTRIKGSQEPCAALSSVVLLAADADDICRLERKEKADECDDLMVISKPTSVSLDIR
jgi:hypothetical protein